MGRRRQNAGFLRLTATALAVLGLLGHGVAMLAVSLLAQTAASSAAAQPSFPAFIEICTADGLTALAASELPGGENRAPAAPPWPARQSRRQRHSRHAQAAPGRNSARSVPNHPNTRSGLPYHSFANL